MRKFESPSSINLYSQCPRRYWYKYREMRKEDPSIHLVRGTIVHDVLENFWNSVNIKKALNDTEVKTAIIDNLHSEFTKKWKKASKQLAACNLTEEENGKFFNESLDMLTNFGEEITARVTKTSDYTDNLGKIRPIVECELKSEEWGIKGRIDVIKTEDGQIDIMDYKTSKEPKISKDYKLQMAIYAKLYEATYGVLPTRLSVYFLKHGIVPIDVNPELMEWAKQTVDDVLVNIKKGTKIEDFPMCPSALCRWDSANGKGNCSFYSECFAEQNFVNGKYLSESRPLLPFTPSGPTETVNPITIDMSKVTIAGPDIKLDLHIWAVEQAVTLLAEKMKQSKTPYTTDDIKVMLGDLKQIVLNTLNK